MTEQYVTGRFKIKFVSPAIVITAVALTLLFVPLVIGRIAQGRPDWGIFENIADIYFYIICFPLVYVLDFISKFGPMFNSDGWMFACVIMDGYIISVIVNNIFRWMRMGSKYP